MVVLPIVKHEESIQICQIERKGIPMMVGRGNDVDATSINDRVPNPRNGSVVKLKCVHVTWTCDVYVPGSWPRPREGQGWRSDRWDR